MVAGLNMQIRLWRMTTLSDDDVGGARVSGTAYADYYARMQGQKEEQLLLQQGLETPRTFGVVFAPGNRDVQERDEVEIINPPDHPYYQKRFRIIAMRHSDFNTRDPRSYTMLTLLRSEIAHDVQ
jgi:hypothetical protein